MVTSFTSGPGRGWRRLRQLPGRVPLRHKLVAAVLALVAVALAVISIAGISLLRGYLLGPVDSRFPGPDRVAGTVLAHLESGFVEAGYGQSLTWYPANGSPQQVLEPVQTSLGANPDGLGGPRLTALPSPAVPTSTAWLGSHTGQPTTVAARSGSGQWRVLVYSVRVPTANGSARGFAVFGQDVSSQYQTIERLREIDLIVSAIVLVGLAIVGVATVRTSLRPLTDIEQTAGRIASGDLSQRVPERDPRTEVGRLGRSLNTMLSQIETAFHAQEASEAAARRSEERMRRFVADASHELRTPLTAIRGYAEYYRQRGGVGNGTASAQRAAGPGRTGTGDAGAPGGLPGAGNGHDVPGMHGHAQGTAPAVTGPALSKADLDRIMQRVEQESTRMGGLVEDMLLLARVDQQRPFERRLVDLLTLTADAVQDARMMAPGRAIDLTVGSDTAFLVLGDEARLRQVISNLMSNALTHTPDGTPVEARIRSGVLAGPAADPGSPPGSRDSRGGGPSGAPAATPGPAVVLEVIDHGPGLTAEQAERVFERFYRADQARTRGRGGNGLGLAIVAALVAAHGGTVSVHTAPGQGAMFAVTLPLAPEALEE